MRLAIGRNTRRADNPFGFAHVYRMDDDAFDRALIAAAFTQAAELGWRHVTVVGAAREAGLPLPRARARFPSRAALLLRFGRIADQAALAELPGEGSVRDQLFDLVMRRIDVLQAHRAGVLALLHALPHEPSTAVLLACATKRSLRWLAQSAGVELTGLRGELKLRGLLAIWLWTLRAWQRDDTADLSATMAALDAALNRAEQAARWLRGRPAPRPSGQPKSQPEAEPPPSSDPSPSPEPFPEPPQENPLP
jgi:ubiquinone biosynthesis protein COQ9